MQRPASPNDRRDASLVHIVCLCLALVTLGLYWPARNYEFNNYDDAQYLTTNLQVQHGLTLPAIRWAFVTGYAQNWHPLTWLSHMLDFQIYGPHAGGHHFTNVLFHVTNSVLLFLLLRRWTGAIWRPAFVAALFAWHPAHVESVAWVAERKDVLSAFFWLLTFFAYGEYAGSRSEANGQNSKRASRYYALSLVLFALGLMSKPMLVSLPVILLLVDRWPLGRMQFPGSTTNIRGLVIEKIPFFLLAIGSSTVTFLVQKAGHAVDSLEVLSIHERLAHATVSYVRYLGELFWPVRLAVLYPYTRDIPLLEIALAAALLLVIFVAAIWFAKDHPAFVVGWLWFFITLIPVIGIVQVGELAWADRYTYIPSIGIFMIIAWEVPRCFSLRKTGQVSGSRSFQAAFALPAVCVLVACLFAAGHQITFWQNSITLFGRATEVTKNNATAECNLGAALASANHIDEAIAHEQTALEIRPDYPEAENDLGYLLSLKGNTTDAIAHLQRAVTLRPQYDQPHYHLGVIYFQKGRIDDAIAEFQSSLQANPLADSAHVNLGLALVQKGRMDDAIEQYQQALQIAPNNPFANNAMGFASEAKGKLQEAQVYYAKAAALKPDFVEAHFNLALAFQRLGDSPDAIDHFQAVLRLKPQTVPALQRLAWLFATDSRAQLRDGAEALRLAQEAIKLVPDDPSNWDAQAAALAELGRYDEAVVAATKAIGLASGQTELIRQIEARRELYRSHSPFRERSGK